MQVDVADGVRAKDARSRVGNNMLWDEKRSTMRLTRILSHRVLVFALFLLCLGIFRAGFL
jgi:hypothetical protein